MNSPDYKAMYETLCDKLLRLKELYVKQAIALGKAEQEIKQLQKALKEAAAVPEWQPIDYSQKDKAPFDKELHLFKTDEGIVTAIFVRPSDFAICKIYDSETGSTYDDGYFVPKFSFWMDNQAHLTIKPTHWMPVPEFMKG